MLDRDLLRANPEAILNDPNARALLREDAILGLKDHYHFSKEILGYKEMDEEVHRPLCEFLYNRKTKKKLVMMPRGTFKSSVVTVAMSTHEIALDPNIRILIANENLSNAQKFLGEIKGHLTQNEYFRLLYGKMDNAKDDAVWNTSEIVVSTRTKNMKEPTIDTAGIGVTKVSRHYDLIIVDDPVSRANVGTKEQIENTLEWYKLLLSLLEPDGRLIVIGTRWDFGDLYGTLQESPFKESFDFYIKQAEWLDEETGERKFLFPKRLSPEFLDEVKRQQGTYVFSCQYLNLPVSSENATFKAQWFKYYIDNDLKNVELNRFLTVDPAISLEKSADFSVFCLCGIDPFNNLYILEIVRKKCLPSEIIETMFDLAVRYKVQSIGIELVAFQKALKYQINDEMRRRNTFFSVVELKHNNQTSKKLRIEGLQPRYEQGTIFHRQGDLMTAELEHELLHFPRGRHDDIIDALSFQLEILTVPSKKKKSRDEDEEDGRKKKRKGNYVSW